MKASLFQMCPICKDALRTMVKVEEGRKGFSVGKAAIGAALVGPVGLVGGALGKKKATYVCPKCGFRQEFDA